MLVTKHLLRKRSAKSYMVFTNCITNDFLNDPTLPIEMLPADYVVECWQRYELQGDYDRTNSLNGKIFELIVETAFYRKGIIPFYTQANATLIPDVDYDIILYDDDNKIPITLSLKTSTRERYKQAALEAATFKSVHRTSLNYILMLYSDEYISVSSKIAQRKILGLDGAVAVDRLEFNDFVDSLSTRNYTDSPTVCLFKGNEIT